MGQEATLEVTVNTSADTLYDVITDFASYPEFVPNVVDTKTTPKGENSWNVEYTLKVIKKINYSLLMIGERPNKVTWSMPEKTKFITGNAGSWELTDNGDGTTLAKYSAQVDVNIPKFIPGASSIVSTLVGSTLPEMMKQFKQRAESKK